MPMIEVPEDHKLDLRNQLHWIVNVERCPLSEQPERIARLAEEMPHSVRLVQEFTNFGATCAPLVTE